MFKQVKNVYYLDLIIVQKYKKLRVAYRVVTSQSVETLYHCLAKCGDVILTQA